MEKKNVLVYRDSLLGSSETFILSQGEGLSAFRSFYVGSRRVSGLEVPPGRSCFISDGGRIGRCREVLFKAFGMVPSAVRETLIRLQPVLVHAHFGPDGVLAQEFARSFRLPLIVTFHGYDATTRDGFARRSSFLHRNYIRKREGLFKGSSRIIASSEFVKRKVMEQGAPEEKIVVHYIGVDTAGFRCLPEVERRQVVLFVGRLVEVKGCTYLVRAMREVQDSCPDAELVVIGDGPLRRQLEDEAGKSLRKFTFLGTQPSHVVKEWMNRARVFSVPSITAKNGNAEGFGIVFAEAQAMGVPVVSFRGGGIPEAVSDGETGFLVPEKDWASLAGRIKSLLMDEPLWRRMSGAARARVEEKFDLKKQNEALERIYMGAVRQYSGEGR